MFAPFPQSARRSVFARLPRVLFVFVMIISNLLLPPATVAQAVPMASVRAQEDAPSDTLLRRTTSDYFPNQSKNIVNLAACERVYGADGMCKSEVRTVYSDFDAAEHNQGGDYAFAPQSNLVAKREQALNICWDGLHIGKYDTTWQATRFD